MSGFFEPNAAAPLCIELTASELRQACVVACDRQIENLYKRRADAHGCPPDIGWQAHIEGAAGEMAFAKWRNRYWSGSLGDLQADDVGNVQVRTRSKHSYDLILHDDDPDDRPFVLLTGLAPRFRVRGWIWGRDGKQQQFWSDPAGGRAAYFVPATALRCAVAA
jgi:hypothetical protein